MGTFTGHALPGTFFICFAVWWIIQIFRRYYHSIINPGTPFKSRATFQCSCLCGKLKHWEIEGFIKVLFTAIGFTGEIITAYVDGRFTHLGNAQHATMFFFFGLSGIVDIIVKHKFLIPLPKGIEYVMMALALTVEGLLFKFHLHGRTDLDVIIHTLLLYAIYASIICVLMELKFNDSVLLPLARALFTLVQGTWFWQVGFILYSPIPGAIKWKENDHGEILIATMMFAWHLGAAFIFILVVGTLIGCIYKCQGHFQSTADYDMMKMQLIKKDANGHTIVNLNDDSDSDVEFERLPLQDTP